MQLKASSQMRSHRNSNILRTTENCLRLSPTQFTPSTPTRRDSLVFSVSVMWTRHKKTSSFVPETFAVEEAYVLLATGLQSIVCCSNIVQCRTDNWHWILFLNSVQMSYISISGIYLCVQTLLLEQEIRSMERKSTQCCCIQYTVIEIFDCNCNDPEIGGFRVIQGQRSWSQSKAHWWFPVWPPLWPTSYLAPQSRYLMRKSCDLELGRSRSSKVKGHGANRYHIGGFLVDFHWPNRPICHRFRDIWH